MAEAADGLDDAKAATPKGALETDFSSWKLYDAGFFAAVDWEDVASRSNDDDDFEDNAVAKNTAAQIDLSPTWISGDEICSFSTSEASRRNQPKSVDDGPTEDVDRLQRIIKILAVALALLVAVAVSLGVALVIVGTEETEGTDGAGTNVATTATSPVDMVDLPEEDELVSEIASVYVVHGNNTSPTQDPISSAPASEEPTASPTIHPTSRPSSWPSASTTYHPHSNPSSVPSSAPVDPFFFGDLSVINDELGIEVSVGLSVKLIATAGARVSYSNGEESDLKFHDDLDGAGIVPLSNGGYVYISNSERDNGRGGVYGVYFDKGGDITGYKALLTKTTRNCAGGLTPWNTWISCEEHSGGQCWQIDPDPSSPNHNNPRETKLGGDGGEYESVAVDNRVPERAIFFVTEDLSDGALRRVEVNGSGWDSLHQDVSTSFLRILDDSNFEWTDNEDDAKDSADDYYPNSEGISFHKEDAKLYFMSKKIKTMFILDLENLTYESEITGKKFYGEGSFLAQPDQSVIFGPRHRHMYFTEDGGSSPGVYARLGSTGAYYTMFQGFLEYYDGDETAGVALSPDGTRFYAGFQEAGLLFEFTREDGFPFE